MDARATVSTLPSRCPESTEREHVPDKFRSILFERPEDEIETSAVAAPGYFADLNCDQIVQSIIAGWKEYDLARFFHAPLKRKDAILYRHEVMNDLEHASTRQAVTTFSHGMSSMRDGLLRAEKLHYAEQKQSWFLDAVQIYCDAVNRFATDLEGVTVASRGLRGLRNYVRRYVRSAYFHQLLAHTRKLKSELATVTYSLRIKGSSFTVTPYHNERDYSAEVEASFAKFAQGAVKDYRVGFSAVEEMNHIEAKIVEFVSKLYPEIFGNLADFCSYHRNYLDRTIAEFDRQVHFYLAYLEYIAPLRGAGLPFCYPSICEHTKQISAANCFDIALARKLIGEQRPVVCNDFAIREHERILLVSGPNQGGKTTFARMFGQVHYLASIGCLVPGGEASLSLFDQMFSHFEKEERVENLRGKLEDDLLRAREILGRATAKSVIIFNEIFTSTTIQDELFLSEKVLRRIIEIDCLCVWVTFADELASLAPAIVSIVSTVDPDDPATRTFRLERRPADGLAYADAIAKKYRLTYSAIRERIQS